jgi:hypothetical protein
MHNTRRYLKKCLKKCDIPCCDCDTQCSDKIVAEKTNLIKEKYSTVKTNISISKYPETGLYHTDDCIAFPNTEDVSADSMFYTITPKICVGTSSPWETVYNSFDNNEYDKVEDILCPMWCGVFDTFSRIYKKVGTNEYCIVFSWGECAAVPSITTFILTCVCFINEILKKYITDNNKLILIGHSAGMTCALMIGQVFAVLPKLKELIRKCDDININSNYCYGDKKYDKLKQVFYDNQYYRDGNNIDYVNECYDSLIDFRIKNEHLIKKNIFIIGSGSCAIFDPQICYPEELYSYFVNRPIHMVNSVFLENKIFIDQYVFTNISEGIQNTPMYIIGQPDQNEFNELSIDEVKKIGNELKPSDANISKMIHEFRNYRESIRKLLMGV